MTRTRLLQCAGLLAISAGCLWAGKKVISSTTTGSNDLIDVTAILYMTQEEVTQKLGVDAGKGIVLLEVRVSPKGDKPLQLSPDDFILLAHDDGERSKPFEPSQLAGKGALVLKTNQSQQSIGIERSRPTVSGLGIPRSGGGAGNGSTTSTTNSAKMDNESKGNDALLTALKAKQFPQKETADPVEGYLYFPLDGKHKLKNMAVLFRGPAGRIDLEFEH
jgi:hypothetical protein